MFYHPSDVFLNIRFAVEKKIVNKIFLYIGACAGNP